MTEKEVLKAIASICKDAEAEIRSIKKDHNFEKPIENDFVKTKKAMAYEEILTEIKKFIQYKKG